MTDNPKLRFALKKGFLRLVPGNANNWFPEMTFYDSSGEKINWLQTDPQLASKMYAAFKKVDNVQNGQSSEIVAAIDSSRILRHGFTIYILGADFIEYLMGIMHNDLQADFNALYHSLDIEKMFDPLIIIDNGTATEIVKAINSLN